MSGRLLVFPGGATEGGGERDVTTDLYAAVEALLFAAGDPVSVDVLCDALQGAEPSEVRRALNAIHGRLKNAEHGIELHNVDDAWQLRTKSTFASAILRLRGGKPQKLSKPALEVLSVVAYRQPVTRFEIEQIRGVDSGGVLKNLLERNLVRVAGRREEPGKPLEYGTTPDFLRLFQLPGLQSLPTLREREELLRDRREESEEP